MKIRNSKVEAVIRELAKKEGCSPAAIRQSIQESIDDAWDNRVSRESTAAWLQYFPDGKKPSVDEFITRLASIIRPL